MISFENVSFGYPQKDIFRSVSFAIEDGEHAALIGSNGTGKSTLLKLVSDTDRYTYGGKIKKDLNGRMGYVAQFVSRSDRDITVFQYLAEPFQTLLKQSDELCAAMEVSENYEEICEKYQQCLDEIDSVDGYNYESNIGRELAIAGLSSVSELSIGSISGGEYKLISIIRNMLLLPQVLLLDEPDVFLDFENLIGLTKLINSYDGTLLAVTHSRLLLKCCFDKILHIENEELMSFPGSYAEYRQFMLEEKIDLAEHTASFDEFISLQQTLIQKKRKIAELNSDPRLGKQLRARVSYLERIVSMRGKDPFLDSSKTVFHFPAVEKPEENSPVFALKDYSLSYESKQLLSDVNFTLNAGDKVAIVGANGTGKSSILRDICCFLEEEGNAPVGFFRQIYERDETSALSGGEQNLMRLHELCNGNAEILLLDEPTSHLDVKSQIALEKAIREYNGTIVMVSHDFFAVTGCADRILILENGTAREMSGRAYRRSIYKKYFTSDIFEQEREDLEKEEKITSLLLDGKFAQAREVFADKK